MTLCYCYELNLSECVDKLYIYGLALHVCCYLCWCRFILNIYTFFKLLLSVVQCE